MVIADPNSIFNIARCNFLMKSNLTENSFDLNKLETIVKYLLKERCLCWAVPTRIKESASKNTCASSQFLLHLFPTP